MDLRDIPIYNGKRIIGLELQPGYQIPPYEIIDKLLQQVPTPQHAYREKGQNSVDAGAGRIDVRFHYDERARCLRCDWLDSGKGMTEEVITNSYLVLFNSPDKENRSEAAGQFGAGRVTMYCLNPESIEVVTRPRSTPDPIAEEGGA